MAGLAAAFGGLATGLASGLKTGSELKDAQERRGLMQVQRESEQLKLDNANQMRDINNKLLEETQNWQKGQGAYAPAEGQTYDGGSEAAADLHMSRIEPLLRQQAVLAGKSELEVDRAVKETKREQFAERSWRAAQLLSQGDASGLDVIKPAYNKIYKDGRQLEGGSFNANDDSFTMNYKDEKTGETKSHTVKRDVLVNNYMLGALNPTDGVKLTMQANENAKDRKLKADEGDKDRSNRVQVVGIQEAGANKRSSAQNETSVKVATIGADSRTTARLNAADLKDSDDFKKEFDTSLGFSQQRAGIYSTEELTQLNKDRSEGYGMYDATQRYMGTKLSGAQVKILQDAYRSGQATIKVDPKTGYAGVEFNGIRGILPPGVLQRDPPPAAAPQNGIRVPQPQVEIPPATGN